MPVPIALQLYSVRDALSRDFRGVLEKVAAMGYVGVETDKFPGTTPQAAAQLCVDLELVVCAAHTAMPLGEKKNEVLDTVRKIGCSRIISGLRKEQFTSLDGVKRACNTINEASAVAVANGFSFGYHNYWWEFQIVDGRPAYQIMLEYLAPEVFLEIDTYWVKTAGVDPAAVIQQVGKRAPLLHLKDGPAMKDTPQVAVGEGVMDFPAVIQAGRGFTEWLVVELDSCATDMLVAVEKSIHYLIEKGLGYGRQS